MPSPKPQPPTGGHMSHRLIVALIVAAASLLGGCLHIYTRADLKEQIEAGRRADRGEPVNYQWRTKSPFEVIRGTLSPEYQPASASR
jgi:hypothetical protein